MPHSYMVSTLSPPVIKNLVRLFYSYKCVTLFAHLCCYYSLKAACLTISRQTDIFFLVCYSDEREGPRLRSYALSVSTQFEPEVGIAV